MNAVMRVWMGGTLFTEYAAGRVKSGIMCWDAAFVNGVLHMGWRGSGLRSVISLESSQQRMTMH